MTRVKKKLVPVPSDNDVQGKMLDYAKASSSLKKVEAEMELKIQQLRDKFKARIDTLRKEKEEASESLQAYAVHNRETLFSKRKSRDLVHGMIGFRTGTPKVVKSRAKTWDRILELLKKHNMASFIRMKEEVDKEKIIASREDKEIMETLGEWDIKVVQDETFFIEVKEEALVDTV